jgi:uncharacterized membrane protein YsdA (DUF1294 family)
MIALRLVLALYALASLIALCVYWYDKRMAKANKMRIPEKTLHWIEALGGWPGALLAQQWLRHKNQKQAYQSVFRVIVIGHLALWCIVGYFYFSAQTS